MQIFTDVDVAIESLRRTFGEVAGAADLRRLIVGLGGDTAVEVIEQTTVAIRALESVRAVATGVVAAESSRERGHNGVSQVRGHRTAISLVQEITGTTRSDAAKQVRVGEALVAEALTIEPAGEPATDAGPDADGDPASPSAEPVARRPWHAPADDALLAGRLTTAQHDAIVRGLGVPNEGREEEWATAVERLVDEAALRTVDELARSARTIRAILDPEEATRRFDEHQEKRSFRFWTRDGQQAATIFFDDEGALWTRTAMDAALRPRRGGPRFVDSEQRAHDNDLADDPRTNEQLAYDLFIDTLVAGALADENQVFGVRQAGIRLVSTVEAISDPSHHVALADDDGTALPATVAARRACDTGTVECTLDTGGNPLYLGREARLFSAHQKLVLAIRDGGCRWRGCDRPASYCEAHHVDGYAEGGRTDVDRGILLCRFHHMNLHHGGWRITRNGTDDFLLHPPGGGEPIPLPPRLHLRYAWGDTAPPPRRFHPEAA